MKTIGKIIATEKYPTTIDEFYFWTNTECLLKPFDVVVVGHIAGSKTYGVIEEISHITDASSFLAGFISSDFGDENYDSRMARIRMNYVKCKVVGNNLNIYTPVLDGNKVTLADEEDIKIALGLDNVKNPLVGGYIEMYEGDNKKTIPVHFNSHFLVGPEGAHLNISGISGLASKTSYAMFLMKAIQERYAQEEDESVAFVMLNVKGRDLLAIDEPISSEEKDKEATLAKYKSLGLSENPFQNVQYFYPYSKNLTENTYALRNDIESQLDRYCAKQYKYIFDGASDEDSDRDNIDLLFANIDDPQETMDSIVNYISSSQGNFANVSNWEELKEQIYEQTKATGRNANHVDKNISVLSWRKFYRIFNKSYERNKSLFANGLRKNSTEVRLQDSIANIKKNDVYVVDVAKLDEGMQGFVFGDVMRAIYKLKLEDTNREDSDIPSRIVIFIDELNKYASTDTPKSSPILRQILDITERGRSLGIVLFGAEQFKSAIHDRVKGNCSTHAYGRTNVIEISKSDFKFIPQVYKSMLTRLKQGEYVLQNPMFRSLLNIKFPKPIYKQYK